MCWSTARKIPCATRAASGECSVGGDPASRQAGRQRCTFMMHSCTHVWLSGRLALQQPAHRLQAAHSPSCCGLLLLLGSRTPPPVCCRRAVPVAPGAKGSPAVIPVALEELAAFSSLRIYIPQDLRTPVGATRCGGGCMCGHGSCIAASCPAAASCCPTAVRCLHVYLSLTPPCLLPVAPHCARLPARRRRVSGAPSLWGRWSGASRGACRS